MKFFNYAQIGVSQDPVYVAASVKDKFVVEMQKAVKKQCGIHTNLSVQLSNPSVYSVVSIHLEPGED